MTRARALSLLTPFLAGSGTLGNSYNKAKRREKNGRCTSTFLAFFRHELSRYSTGKLSRVVGSSPAAFSLLAVVLLRKCSLFLQVELVSAPGPAEKKINAQGDKGVSSFVNKLYKYVVNFGRHIPLTRVPFY